MPRGRSWRKAVVDRLKDAYRRKSGVGTLATRSITVPELFALDRRFLRLQIPRRTRRAA
jgi:hypothetical protein